MARIYGSPSEWCELHEWLKANKREYVMFLCQRPTDDWTRRNLVAVFPSRILPILKDECPLMWLQSQIKAELSL